MGATPAELETHSLLAEVCGAPDLGQAPAEIRITWHAFAAGEDHTITDYAVEVTRASPALQLSLQPDKGLGGASLTSGAPWVAVAAVQVACTRQDTVGCQSVSYDGGASVQIRATGGRH